ncbi:MAG: hypothetical protein HYX27_22185 [Acidobacteria bacterium]|nr:hypothetical protein [Acidobacteriota bacterium]
MSESKLPARPSLVQLRKQARELLEQFRADGAAPAPKLADAQFAIARKYGFASWAKLKQHVEARQPTGLERYEDLAAELATAYMAGDKTAIREINWNFGTSFTWDHEPEKMQAQLPNWFAAGPRTPDLAMADARRMVAHSYGIESWESFAACLAQPEVDPRSAPVFMNSRPPFYQIDWKDNTLSVRGPLGAREWETVYGVMREHGITKLRAGGMADAGMAGLAALGQVTRLELGGHNGLTDEGLLHLAKMPQLEELEVGGWKSVITDHGMAFLGELKRLREFKSAWTQGISDVGLVGLAVCDALEEVNLIGTPAGDGTIAKLAGKEHLRKFTTGRGVTDAGIRLLHGLPVFKGPRNWDVRYSLMSFQAEPSHLMIDGPFTDAGLRGLGGLDGLCGLSFFWHCPAFTSAGLEGLRQLPALRFLGCQDRHCDDEAMRQIAAIPALGMLMGQGAVAEDEGFAALAASRTLEYFWGRDCPNFASAGFTAMAEMPSLRGLAVSLKNVDDEALGKLPRFPALRQLMPMNVDDAGFRHVGECENLENLWCMYCRETGDAATEFIGGLRRLKTYYAGKTLITDRSLEILGRMESLEKLEFWQCAGVTDAGVAHLAELPRLKEISLDGLPNVTRRVAGLFGPEVRVSYSG